MSDEYCYPHTRLSIWQAAAEEVQIKYNQPTWHRMFRFIS
jgi:hypothetical protein